MTPAMLDHELLLRRACCCMTNPCDLDPRVA
jgi:hypothetical protein